MITMLLRSVIPEPRFADEMKLNILTSTGLRCCAVRPESLSLGLNPEGTEGLCYAAATKDMSAVQVLC